MGGLEGEGPGMGVAFKGAWLLAGVAVVGRGYERVRLMEGMAVVGRGYGGAWL